MSWLNYRSRFFLNNLVKGLAVLGIIVVVYIFLQKYTPFESYLDNINQWPLLVYSVFVLSEVIFGIIPPELFMIWSIKGGLFEVYALDIALLSVISYLSGVLGYIIGTRLKEIKLLEQFFKRYVTRYSNIFNRFGGLLILVAAITPIPFSAICMLVGSVRYNFYKFLLIATARIARFSIYSIVIYQANI